MELFDLIMSGGSLEQPWEMAIRKANIISSMQSKQRPKVNRRNISSSKQISQVPFNFYLRGTNATSSLRDHLLSLSVPVLFLLITGSVWLYTRNSKGDFYEDTRKYN